MDDFRVIIIDPDPTTTKYLAFELKKAGLTVFSTNNAKEGLVLAYQQRPHVIIFEPITKDLSAEEFLSKIKKRSAHQPLTSDCFFFTELHPKKSNLRLICHFSITWRKKVLRYLR